jgi:hypothetical protein
MARIKIYSIDYIDKTGNVIYSTTFQAETKKEAISKAFDYKFYKLPYGSGRLKSVITVIGKL